jgi:hypothetical protein
MEDTAALVLRNAAAVSTLILITFNHNNFWEAKHTPSISCLLPESAPFLTPRMDERSSEHVVSRMDEQADFFLLGFDESRRSTLFLTPKE